MAPDIFAQTIQSPMQVRRHISTILVFLIGIYANTNAQQPYFLEENIPSAIAEIKHVNGIAADKNNCIWFATQTGVFRYDGSRFLHFSVLNTPVLQFERMGGFVQFRNKTGLSWALLDGKGHLYEVDNNSRLQPFSLKDNESEQIIFQHLEIPAGKLLPVTHANDSSNKKLFEVYGVSAGNRIFLIQEDRDIIGMPYQDFLKDRQGKLLFSGKGITKDKTIITDKNFYAITPGNLLCWKKDMQEPDVISLSGDILKKNSSVDLEKLKGVRSTGSDILLLWYDGSIYEASETPGKNELQTKLLITETSKEIPLSVFYSPEQQLFIAYFEKKGLVIYRPRQFTLLSWDSQESNMRSIDYFPNSSIDYYYSILPANNGFITINDLGVVWLGINGEKKMLVNTPCRRFFIFKDRRGNIWHQQDKGEMICYLEPATKKTIPIIYAQTHNAMIGIYQPDDSTYYILTNHYLKKIILQNAVAKKEELLYRAPGKSELNFLYVLQPGVLWLGSDQGLVRFNLKDNSTQNIKALENTYVRAVTAIGENNYLIGTYDKGIFQYKNDRWIHLSSTGKKMPASAHGFIIDKLTSSVWVSSNEGILRLSLPALLDNTSKSEIAFAHFSNFGSGIPPEFNGSSNISAATLSDSCIAFANAKGIVTFNPLRLISYPLPVTVLAEPVEREVVDSSSVSPYQIEFNPVVPYFGNREDLTISYRLTNSDDHWHNFSANSIISYNNVGPGSHELQFRISNSHDRNGKEVFIVANSFTIPYRWYQTTLFKVLAIALALAIVILLHNIRIWYLRKRKRELEQLVKTKTSELQKSNWQLSKTIDDLKLSEEDLRQSNYLKDEYFAVLTHDLRSPLRFLSFNICQLLDMLPELESAQLKKGLVVAYECTNDVSKLIDDFVYWIRNNENQLQPHPVSTMINPVVADIQKLYGFSMDGNNNKLITDIPPGLRFTTDQQMFFIMLRNAVDNANKYTSAGTITISVKRVNENLEITVADTGCGINEELVHELTQLQYDNAQFGHKKRRSLGFYIMAMLTKKLKGSYTISSVIGRGTVLSFVLPELVPENESLPQQ